MSLKSKLLEAIRNPRLVLYFLRRKKYTWSSGSSGFVRKQYASYDDYIRHQREKLDRIQDGTYSWFGDYDTKYRTALHERLSNCGEVKSTDNVLCLAARLGTEVKAFLDMGCFALGLDLNPGRDNRYVVTGDFHEIQFPDHCVDVVFCNSLDHAFDIHKLMAEIRRVLKPRGKLILEINTDDEDSEGGRAGYFEALAWDSFETLLGVLEEHGLRCISKQQIDYPWQGMHAYFSFERDARSLPTTASTTTNEPAAGGAI